MLTETYLQEIQDFIGIEELQFNQQGESVLELREKFLLVLKLDRERRSLFVMAEIESCEDPDSELLLSSLEINFISLQESRIITAVDPKTKKLFLVKEFLLQSLTPYEFRRELEQFIEKYFMTQGILIPKNALFLGEDLEKGKEEKIKNIFV